MTPHFEILYEDNHILVCIKPAGTPTQSGNVRTPDMESQLKTYLYPKGCQYLGIVHRLDTPVKGVMVFAKTTFAASKLSGDIKNNKFIKTYHAKVVGKPSNSSDTLIDYLLKSKTGNVSAVVPNGTQGAKQAKLSYKVLSYDAQTNISLLEIRLETGRHHQIRVQLSHAGFPIVGDTKYGNADAEKGDWHKLQLEASELTFSHPKTQKRMTFSIINNE